MIAVFIILATVAIGIVWGCFAEMSEQRRLKSMAKDVRGRA